MGCGGVRWCAVVCVSGLESALSKLPQEVKSHQENEDIPGQILEHVELIQPDKCGRCDQNDEDSERALLHGVKLP